jgi:squalene-hopene/tetraprenyl-beta-curcumene cyclase
MKSFRMSVPCLASVAAVFACPPLGEPTTGSQHPAWSPAAAQKYLDQRAASWLEWGSAARGQGTSCISCHTAVPYALARPALTKLVDGTAPAEAEKRMLAGIRSRVERWAEIVSPQPRGKDPLVPFYGGSRRDAALDTEAVLNAVVLVRHDVRTGGALSAAAGKALDHMWDRQGAGGSWRWLDFGLRPWETGEEYLGATLAAVAAGSAGDRYPRFKDTAIRAKDAALRKYLSSRIAERPFHDRAFALWAASYLNDVLTDAQKKQAVGDLLALQRPDGGWSLADLGKTQTGKGAAGWKSVLAHPADAQSDGYATGLVVLALRRAGIAETDARLKKGLAWLTASQAADGTWPAVYLNKKRDPAENVGKFMRDASTAFAVLALAAGG